MTSITAARMSACVIVFPSATTASTATITAAIAARLMALRQVGGRSRRSARRRRASSRPAARSRGRAAPPLPPRVRVSAGGAIVPACVPRCLRRRFGLVFAIGRE